MRLGAERSRRVLPMWPVLVVVAIGAGIALLHVLSRGSSIVCTTRRLTGVPCPTCGSTRAVMAMVRGDVAGALAYNPLTVVALACVGVVLGLRVGFGRQVRLEASGREWTLLAAGLLVLLGINWAWVLWRHGML